MPQFRQNYALDLSPKEVALTSFNMVSDTVSISAS